MSPRPGSALEAELLAAVDGGPLSDRAAAASFDAGLAPLLGARKDASARLRQAHRDCLARSLHTEATLAELARRFADRGLPFLLLKGAALIGPIYRPGERPLGDLDVLVPARRWREACALAGEAIVPDGRPITARHDYCQALRAPQGTVVEIHRWLCPRGLFTIDHEGLFARARDGRMPAEDILLTLVVHAAKHGFRLPLRAVVDTRRVVSRLRPDGAVVASRALAWGAARATLAWLERCGVAGLVAPHLAGVGAAPTAGTGRLLGILLATDRPRRAVSFVSQRLVLHAADALWRLAGVRA